MGRIVLVAVLMASSAALAQSIPAGWSQSENTYTHTASGIACPTDVAGYTFKSIAGPSDPNFDGVCTYDKGGSETGLIRVRHYVDGVGETPMAIQNDYRLMHPDIAGGPGKIMGTVRGGPGPVVDGVQTYQLVLTTIHNGFLVDCISRHTDKSAPPSEFALACNRLMGQN
jgi:hypothetical protein